MKYLLSIFAVGFVCLSVNAIQLPYKQLKKTYETNTEKALKRAESWMKILPNNPAPYYYASLIHFEIAQKETTIRKKYSGLSMSLKYARLLEKQKDQSFLDKVDWDTLTPIVQDFTQLVFEELNDAELYKLSALLERKAKRFDWMEDSNTSDVAELESNTETETTTSRFVNGNYYGMPTGSEVVPSYNLSSERELLEYINTERLKKGMKALVWDENLANAARYHAYDMGTQNYFDHDSYDRSRGNRLSKVGGTFERIKKFYSSSFVNSENIAAGNQGAHDTYMQWYHSKGHYENMFNESSGKIGIGVVYVSGSTYGYYWVMNTAH
ncbi:MAG: CAP domain-containing protein [Fluviicola sp.]